VASEGERPRRQMAVVTGGSSGIGEAIARRLAADSAQVMLVARSAEGLEQVAASIRAAGGRAHSCAIDLAEPGAAERVIDAAQAAMGGIDMLVNCASLTHNADFFTITDDQWEAAFAVKVFAATRLCRTAWPALAAAGGSIVNIAGIGARTPRRHIAVTAMTSSALVALTKVLADAGVDDGVQVNAINPGMIRTPRIERTIGERGGAGVDAALTQVSRAAGAIRVGRPEDVAALVAYIFSPAGELLQGAIIDLDGGSTKGI
jgi:NAD(P)-dependent dehydrogenase (short-subunit alcohol dehydrogenase family)